MRVWLVEPFGRGGIARYAVDVANLLHDGGVEATVATASDGPAPGCRSASEVWFRTGDRSTPAKLRGAFGSLRAARTRPLPGDVAWMALGHRPHFERVLVPALRRSGAMVVGTVHNRRPHEGGGGEGQVAAAARGCDAIVVHNATMQRWARGEGIDAVLLPFPPPDELSRGRAHTLSRGRLAIPEEAIVLAMIGNAKAYKGVDVMLEAVAAAQADMALPVVLFVAGQVDPALALLDRVAALGIERSVRVIDRYLTGPELADVLAISDCAALPYQAIDHSGVAALVANAGLPALATDLPGLAEVLGDAALYVPVGDMDALCRAIRSLPAELEGLRGRAKERAMPAGSLTEPYVAVVRAVAALAT
jgi:glycosyltransferase involved in cell wall biosynthesis